MRTKIRRALLVVAALLIVVALCLLGYSAYRQLHLMQVQHNQKIVGAPSESETQPVSNPIDFATLKQENPDIYAWIVVPDTNVDYPIVQSDTSDNYYLNHAADRSVSAEGAIYTQCCNSKDFNDPVTVIYGHNIYTAHMMFNQLHYFEDPDFFNQHDVFYIYTESRLLTYQVVSAYEYDNRHIMNAFDFEDSQVRREYFDSVIAPDSLAYNVREGVGLAISDKIVQLSTCVASGDNACRYIVTGKLINDQLTS